MEKEGHGAARRDMIVGFGGLIENGKDGVYGCRKSLGRVYIAEEDIGAGVIKIKGREAKLWSWETGFRMWTITRFIVADSIVRALDEWLETNLNCVPLHSVFSSVLLFGAEGKRGGSRFKGGSGHGERRW